MAVSRPRYTVSEIGVLMYDVDFKLQKVPTQTPERLREAMGRGRPVVVHGLPGSGRSTAVQQVLPEAVWLPWGQGGDRGARLALSLAAALHDQNLLQVYKRDGIASALARADGGLADRPLAVVGGDTLVRARAAGWVDDLPGMLQPADDAVRKWILNRAGTTVVVADRSPDDSWSAIRHSIPTGFWPVKPRYIAGGEREWKSVADKLGIHLDQFPLLQLVARLTNVTEFDALVEVPQDEMLLELGRIIRTRAPEKVRLLGIVNILSGLPAPIVRDALALSTPRSGGSAEAYLRRADQQLARLETEGLVRRLGDTVRVIGAAQRSLALDRRLSVAQARPLWGGLIQRVPLTQIRNPDVAQRVFAAHRIAVAAGLVDEAVETAMLHADGLITLGRELSIDRDFEAAWRVYDGALRVMGDPPPSGLERTRAYALNWRALNGLSAQVVEPSSALEDVSKATAGWPKNAAFHGHLISLLAEQGRFAEALAHVARAEELVPEHPQRARYLRVRPALRIGRCGRPQAALRLLQLDTPQWAEDPESHDLVAQLFGDLAEDDGLQADLLDLPGRGLQLVFRKPLKVALRRVTGSRRWLAKIASLDGWAGVAASPDTALEAVTAALADDLHGLLGTPSAWLTPTAARRKAWLLSRVEVLGSDLGLSHVTERWFVGTVSPGLFSIADGRVALDVSCPQSTDPEPGVHLARVTIDREGIPTGAVLELEFVGRGLTAEQVREALAERWGRDADAG